MRMFQPRTGSRPLRAGIAAVATAAAVVAGTSVPAWAVAASGTLDTTTGAVGGGFSVKLTTTLDAMDPATYTAAKARFSTSCDSTFGTTSSTKPEAAVTLDAGTKDDATATVPSLAAGTYKMCVYGGTSVSGTTALIASSSNNLVLAATTTKPTLSPAAGTSAGGTSVTATGLGPWLATGGSSLGVTFRTTTCTSPYTATSPIVATTATKNTANTIATFTVPTTLPSANSYNVCVYAGATNTSALLGWNTYAALTTSTVSPTAGNSGGTNTIIVTTKTAVVTSAPAAIFSPAASCPATYDAVGTDDEAVSAPTRISSTKVAITVPAGVEYGGVGETTPYNVCLYADGTTGKLLAVPAVYSVATALDLTGAAILPIGGPALGGSTITVTVGGGLPTTGGTISASLGTSPLENIVVSSDTEFTATTTAHAAGAEKLTVTTAAGSQTSSTTVYTFSYGIVVAPTTAAPSDTVTLDILGSGFGSLTYSALAEAGGAAKAGSGGAGVGVYLVDNGWYAAAVAGDKVSVAGLESQCTGVTKISDNELICTLDLSKSIDGTNFYYNTGAVASGVYNIAVVNDASLTTTLAVDTNISRISSGSVFTVASY